MQCTLLDNLVQEFKRLFTFVQCSFLKLHCFCLIIPRIVDNCAFYVI